MVSSATVVSFLRLNITSNPEYHTIIKPTREAKLGPQICTTVSQMSASHCLQNNAHNDLQNTKNSSIDHTQKYFKMSLPCNSKAVIVKLPHPFANWLNTAVSILCYIMLYNIRNIKYDAICFISGLFYYVRI